MQTPDHSPPAPSTLYVEDRDLELLRQKLRFRAWRRGTSEADLLLGGFVDRHVATLSRVFLEQLEQLLDVDDPLVEAWVFGRRPAPATFDNAALAMLRDHVRTQSCAGRP
jgi:antitoxin CptB